MMMIAYMTVPILVILKMSSACFYPFMASSPPLAEFLLATAALSGQL